MDTPQLTDLDPDDLAKRVLTDLNALTRGKDRAKVLQALATGDVPASTTKFFGRKISELDETRVQFERIRREEIESGSESISAAVLKREKRLKALIRGPLAVPKPSDDAFVISGKIQDTSTNLGLPDVTIRAQGRGRGARADTFAMSARSMLQGRFVLTIPVSEFREICGDTGKLTLVLLDEDGKPLPSTATDIVVEAGRTEFVEIKVTGEMLPRARASAEAFDVALTSRLDRMTQRVKRISNGIALLRAQPPSGPPERSDSGTATAAGRSKKSDREKRTPGAKKSGKKTSRKKRKK